MAELTLGFKAWDVHELACHFVARHAGLYTRHGLEPSLLDTSFIAEPELPQPCFQAACAAALAAWLGGADQRVVFVAADRPMFWLCARPEIREVAALRGKAVADFPAPAPPSRFLRELLRDCGLGDTDLQLLPARDDVARLGLLRDGSVAAALLSSAVPPAILDRLGIERLAFLGDALSVATTGLAVPAALASAQPALVTAMCACYRDALELIHTDDEIVTAALKSALVCEDADATSLLKVLRHCYTRDGRSSPARLSEGVRLLAAAFGKDQPPAAELYDFSFLDTFRDAR